MPEKTTTVAAYAAGASLAAVALFYVFGPNYMIDGDDATGANRKKNIVGLANPANDCFINSVLQALAGLGGLRVYLIRELHRRDLDGPEVYSALPRLQDLPHGANPERIRELQQGTITRALKEMLDRLNERPIYKKTISARGFVRALEYAFRTRISRNQQDAQEFLQIIAERLSDEYHAGLKARRRAQGVVAAIPGGGGETTTRSPIETSKTSDGDGSSDPMELEIRIDDGSEEGLPAIVETKLKEIDTECGFPFEGKLESQIECQFCHYQYKPNQTSFVNLTLQVPQKSSTTLSACFDGLLKTEYIDEFRCEKCRLQHALELKINEKSRTTSEKELERLEVEIERIQEAIRSDPEQPLDGVTLPAAELAPKRKIARHMRITVFPKIIAIHLSRSIFDRTSSTKNAAKVAFPEKLALGGILDRKWFKLLAIVCHKGSHNSGHYESFRRNHLYPPFATPDVFSSYAQSRVGSENPSEAPSPRIPPRRVPDVETASTSTVTTTPSSTSPSSPSLTGEPLPASVTSSPLPAAATPPLGSTPPSPRPMTPSSRSLLSSSRSKRSLAKYVLPPTSEPQSPIPGQTQPRSSLSSAADTMSRPQTSPAMCASSPTGKTVATSGFRRRRKGNDRWWRISDDKVKECKTSDVLGMQKEVYLLFYELSAPDTDL